MLAKALRALRATPLVHAPYLPAPHAARTTGSSAKPSKFYRLPVWTALPSAQYCRLSHNTSAAPLQHVGLRLRCPLAMSAAGSSPAAGFSSQEGAAAAKVSPLRSFRNSFLQPHSDVPVRERDTVVAVLNWTLPACTSLLLQSGDPLV